MKQFKYFMCGIVSILLIPRIIDKVLELFDVWIESLKIKPTRKILEHQRDTALMSEFINNKSNNDEDIEEVIYYYGYEDDEE